MHRKLTARDIAGIGMTSQRTRDRLVSRLRGLGIADERVLAAIGSVPRHLFVDEAMASRAYEDKALPIGLGQTISQPYVVALMTSAAIADGPRKVLEIGTGSGYQAALLSRLVPEVYTLERLRELHQRARTLLAELGYRNVRTKLADGRDGWPEAAPFDAIVVTAAPESLPRGLLEQLAGGGRLIAPIGRQHAAQQLSLIRRNDAEFSEQVLELVSFVPFLAGTQ